MDIICPECGGDLVYWKEYYVTKTQSISKNGVLNKHVQTTQQEETMDLEGFECTNKNCHWIFNTVNDVEKCEKYPHLTDWIDEHESELKV